MLISSTSWRREYCSHSSCANIKTNFLKNIRNCKLKNFYIIQSLSHHIFKPIILSFTRITYCTWNKVSSLITKQFELINFTRIYFPIPSSLPGILLMVRSLTENRDIKENPLDSVITGDHSATCWISLERGQVGEAAVWYDLPRKLLSPPVVSACTA